MGNTSSNVAISNQPSGTIDDLVKNGDFSQGFRPDPIKPLVSEPEVDKEGKMVTPTDPNAPLTWLQRFVRADTIIIYTAIVIVFIIFLISFGFGVNTDWYNSLQLENVNVWIPRSFWVITTIISYIGLWFIWSSASSAEVQRNLGVSTLFLIGSFLILSWSFALYQAEKIAISFWFALVLFVFQFWLFNYILQINVIAGLLQIPLVLMYGYLVWSMANLCFINNDPI